VKCFVDSTSEKDEVVERNIILRVEMVQAKMKKYHKSAPFTSILFIVIFVKRLYNTIMKAITTFTTFEVDYK